MEIEKKSLDLAGLNPSEKREMVEALRTDYSVRQICDTLGLNRSSLYYEPNRDSSEEILREEIERLAARYLKYGNHRRITQLLLRMGYTIGYRRVARLMKEDNLWVSVKRACQTTESFDCVSQWGNRLDNLEICRRN